MQCAGIVLCGGESRRMGQAKASLPFGEELLLERMLRLLRQVADPLLVVAAAGQSLPPLDSNVLIARDNQPQRGPVEALYAGLSALPPSASVAFVTGCDCPLLMPAIVSRLVGLLGTHQAVVPLSDSRPHPLCAVYRRNVLPELNAMRQAQQWRLRELLDRVDRLLVPADELRDIDPTLESLANINTPGAYLDALARAGLSTKTDVPQQHKAEQRLID
ncbi:MAG: molybdenum cofactor guanylyltransferase [Pirellulaceae bacterium]|nr:molybdenum cofactor guanylyltransferase [Pirellulaceae bacterium]